MILTLDAPTGDISATKGHWSSPFSWNLPGGGAEALSRTRALTKSLSMTRKTSRDRSYSSGSENSEPQICLSAL